MKKPVQKRQSVGRAKHTPAAPEYAAPIDRYSDEDVTRALAAVSWNFADAKTDYFAHGLHPYPAKFIPQIPRTLVSILSDPGDLVWDPFGGSGTTALESLLLGRRALSTDINPVAEIVGKAKTTTLTPEVEFELAQFGSELKMLSHSPEKVHAAIASQASDESLVPDIPNIEKWFEPTAIEELAYLRLRTNELSCDDARIIARAVFSKLILSASNQDAETRYSCVTRQKVRGEVLSAYARMIAGAIEKLQDQSVHLQFRSAQFCTVDLRAPLVSAAEGAILSPASVDLVVTSPPYPNATDYHLYHRFRIFWLGHDPRTMANSEIGSHLRHQKQGTEFASYVEEMSVALQNVHAALKPGALAVLVLGDALFKGKTFRTATHLGEAAERAGLRVVGIIDRDLPENKRSFISPARRLRREQLLILRKPSARRAISLTPPPYRLQPYEDRLRELEAERLVGRVTKVGDDLEVTASPKGMREARRLAFCAGIRPKSGRSEKTWQALLENGDALRIAKTARKSKDPKYVTHGIHPYKGKFYPQLAKALMNISGTQPGATVLDPFCGSGTVLLEASLSGLDSIGFDINPVAVATAQAKTSAVHANAVYRDHLLGGFERKLAEFVGGKRATAQLPYTGETEKEILSWFPANVVPKLAQILHEIELVADESTRQLLQVLVSSIIRDISHQDPRDLRIRRREKPLEDAPVYEMMVARAREARGRLRHFAQVSNAAPAAFGNARAMLADSSLGVGVEGGVDLSPGAIDLIVTSPPYATALPYIDTDRLSLLACHGMTARTRKTLEDRLIGTREIKRTDRERLDKRIEAGLMSSVSSSIATNTVKAIHGLNSKADVGFRRKNTAALLLLYFEKMNATVKNITPAVKHGGSAFVVLGNTRTTAGGKEIVIRSGAVTEEQFQSAGWETVDVFPITVTRENVVHSKNSITDNEIYWFRKTGS